jgi:hypothetical protein
MITSLTCSTCLSFGLVAPFLPLEIEKQGYDVTYMGSIMAIYAISDFCSNFLVPYVMMFVPKRKLLIILSLVLFTSMALFAVLMDL